MKTTLVRNPSVFYMKITTFRGTQSASSGEKMWSEIERDVILVVTISTNVYFRPHFFT